MLGNFRIISNREHDYPRFHVSGKTVVVQLTSVIAPNTFVDNLDNMLEYLLKDAEPYYMIGIKLYNEIQLGDKAIGLSFRRKDQISSEVMFQVLEKVIQSNARFSAYDKLLIHVDTVLFECQWTMETA